MTASSDLGEFDGICSSCGALPCDQTDPPTNRTASSDLVAKRGDVEKVARIIAPERWATFDGYLEQTQRKYKGQNVSWPVDQFQDKESMRKAHSIVDLFDSVLAARDATILALEADKAALVEALGAFVDGADNGHVTVKVDNAARATLAKHGGEHLLDEMVRLNQEMGLYDDQ